MERLGEYEIGRLIGEGGMGKVYEAQERLSKRRVALKVLKPELARSPEGRKAFLGEMTILAHLDHPNIVRCLSCSEVEGELVMSLELLEGSTLRALLAAEGRLPWARAVEAVAQVAAALQAAHGQDPAIVHRDLKPENVMLCNDGVVKVMDFGIAKVLAAAGSTTTASVGTLQYMSPEQIDAGSIGPASDLYGLGLLLYEMLAGHPPFESSSPRELLNLQCTAAPPALPDEVRSELPRGIETLLRSLLEKDPDERPSDAAAVLDQLAPFRSAGTPVFLQTMVPNSQERSSIRREEAAQSRPTARRPRASSSSETLGLVSGLERPREVPRAWAFSIIFGMSALAGASTHWLLNGSGLGTW